MSLGREISSIDDLFVSPSGFLTIVETKLWRNPESHRTVIAQILEYAKVLTTWTYSMLDRAEVQSILSPGDEVEVAVSGELIDGTPFEGTDTIRVIE